VAEIPARTAYPPAAPEGGESDPLLAGGPAPQPSIMVFSTPLFIFGFLPAVLAVYFLAPVRLRNHVALAFSFLFYAWGAPEFIFVVLASCFVDWTLTNRMHAATDPVHKKRYLHLAVAQNLLLLGWFKYIDFSIASVNSALGWMGVDPLPLLNVALPIGISFITFEKITYVVDVHRGEGSPAPSFLTYLLYVHYFPQLIAGPIIKYHDIEEQFYRRSFSLDNVVIGLSRFSVGLAKKVLVADALAIPTDAVFALPPEQLDPMTAWFGSLCFTMQIYFDFSGYSDMAIGIARAMGFQFHENFNQPYISKSITEFWQRWHISFATWIRSYLYIPLGGNRKGTARTYVNLWLCFFLSGLWHGAAWTFVIWGTYQGTLLIFERVGWLDVQKRLPGWLNVAYQFFVSVVGMTVFRADSLDQILYYVPALFHDGSVLPSGVEIDLEVGLHLGIALFLTFVVAMPGYVRFMMAFQRWRWRDEAITALAIVLFALSVGRIAGASFSPFLYFRF
jgi:alginate O-acetyltransferase complex protein AlgI